MAVVLPDGFARALDAAAGIIEGRELVAIGELAACAASAGIALAAAMAAPFRYDGGAPPPVEPEKRSKCLDQRTTNSTHSSPTGE